MTSTRYNNGDDIGDDKRAHTTPEPDMPPPTPETDPPPDNMPLPDQAPIEEPKPPEPPIKA